MGVPKKMPEIGRSPNGQIGFNRKGVQAHRYTEAYDMSAPLKAPYPWPGGKSDVAAAIWSRFGDPPNFVEPFMGSAAVLLARPHDFDGKTETINDLDGFLTCAYRSIAYAPEETAYWCDRPVNECDLTSFHLWLKAQRPDLTERLFADPFYYDPVVAGAYLWGAASWIGDGWCVADGPWINVDGKLVDRRTIGSEEEGVCKKMPIVGAGERGKSGMNGVLRSEYRNAPGVPRKMPDVGAVKEAWGNPTNQRGIRRYQAGVPKQMPIVSAGNVAGGGYAFDQGVQYQRRASPAALLAYFDRLATRLRRVRILCGDWKRVVKPSITVNHGLTAVMLDSPYLDAEHSMGYHTADGKGEEDIWFQSTRWAIENGDNPLLRIAVCGYISDQTDAMFPLTWERYRWEARGGYSNQSKNGRGRTNAKRECVWFSPHCINAKTNYGPLFEEPAR